jgi:hypothetical protein
MRTALLALLLGASACADELDPLSIEAVNDLSVTGGNATGVERSGTYDVLVQAIECGACPEELQMLGTLSACASLDEGTAFVADVLHTDGVLAVDTVDTTATGPLDSDGRFAAGAVADLSLGLAEGHVIVRIEGAFDPDAVPDELEATLRQRIVGTVGETSVDCIGTVELWARRRSF